MEVQSFAQKKKKNAKAEKQTFCSFNDGGNRLRKLAIPVPVAVRFKLSIFCTNITIR